VTDTKAQENVIITVLSIKKELFFRLDAGEELTATRRLVDVLIT